MSELASGVKEIKIYFSDHSLLRSAISGLNKSLYMCVYVLYMCVHIHITYSICVCYMIYNIYYRNAEKLRFREIFKKDS